MDSYNPSGLTEEQLNRLNNTEIQEYTGDPDDPSTPDTTPSQTRQKEREEERLEEERIEAEQIEQSKFDYKSQSGRYSAGTEADYKAMEVLGPIVAGAAGLPFIDLAMDAVGMAGGQAIDDAWDEKTKFESPLSQNVRDVTGIIVPTIVGTMALGPVAGSAAFRATGGSAIARGLAKVFTTAAVDVSVVGVSDYSERDEGIAASLDLSLIHI